MDTTTYYVKASQLAFFVSLALRINACIVSIVACAEIGTYKAEIVHYNNRNAQQFADFFSPADTDLDEQIVFDDDAIDPDPVPDNDGEAYPVSRTGNATYNHIYHSQLYV